MENEKIIKIGVGPRNDADLLEACGIRVRGTFDLRFMAALADCQAGTLAKMSEDYLGMKLKKGSNKALHLNWNASTLSNREMEYAAMDVHAAVKLFEFFTDKILKQRHQIRYLSNERDRVNFVITEYCSKFVDKYYN